MEPPDPSASGFGLPLNADDAGRKDTRALVLHPRAAAWLWIIPICLCGLILSSCNFFMFLAPEQAGSDSRSFFMAFGILGLGILAAPILSFFNAELRLSDGVIVKRGLLRRTRRWEAADIVRIHPYVRYMAGPDAEAELAFLNYVVYRFLLKGGAIAFDLTQAWWKTSDIEDFAKALDLYIPAPSRD